MFRTHSNDNSVGVGVNLHTPAKAMRQLFLFVLLTHLSISSKGYAAENYIDYKYYEGTWSLLPDFDTLTPVADGAQETFALTGARADHFGFVYTAKLFVTEAGTYTFYLSSDDGSKLLINDAVVVDFDGLHGSSFVSGTVSLGVGAHDIEIQYFEHTGAAGLAVEWEGPNQVRTALQSFLNPDYDDDGIDNAIEGIGDTDGDGTADYLDEDSDGDTIPDSIEGIGDTDSDGTPNYLDEDSDGDTVPDSIEGSVDSDNDGTPDYLDTDDNGDGVPTIAQAGIGDGSATYPFTSLSAALNAPAGVYWFETSAGTFQGNVDDTEGGGWITILNYLHLGGTNPDVAALTNRLPLIASSTLGTDESASATAWGHTSPALLASLDPAETRWYAETSAHGRVIHFSTPFGINYLTSGTGDMIGVNADFTALTGHTANLPASAGSTVGNSGDLALTNFPYYKHNTHHWGVRGHGSRWEVDDYPSNASNDTFHRVWARGDQLTSADLANSNSDVTPDYREVTDTDGDGILDALDRDDDNDGILDINEGALITPTGGAISSAWAGRDHNLSINDSSLNSVGDSIGSVTTDNQTIINEPDTAGWIEYNLPTDSDVLGIALWAPGVPFSGEDAPIREFTVTVTYNNGQTWTSLPLFTDVPTAVGFPGNAQVFDLGQIFKNVTDIRLNIQNGWVNQGGNHSNYASTDEVVVVGNYNMTLGEFRAIVSTGDTDNDLVPNKNDLDSDNDGISDLFESGAPSGWIAADANNDGTVSIAEAEAVLGVGNADTDNDGLLDIFGRFIMDENSGWVATDAARAANNSRYQAANNGIEPTAGSNYIHFDSLNNSWAHSEYRDLGAVFQPGIYEFTVDVSNVGNLGWPANTFAQVTSGVSGAGAGATVTPTSSITPVPASATSEIWTITVKIPSTSPLIGQAIGFEVGVGAPNGLNENAGFDNLKMSFSPLDTDADTVADYLDLDSDNDSIPDTIEASPTIGYSAHADNGSENIDTDGDGILNKYDSNSVFGGTHSSLTEPENTDAVDTPDYIDLDSDNDGLTDDEESGLSLVTDATYADVDGTEGLPRNTDGDIESDFRDLDSDGDGINDQTEGTVDTDNDSTPDYLDTDSDNDGTDDVAEGTGDEDGDGIPDYQDNFFDVIHDAVVWFRADEGVSDSGAGVSSWADQSSFGTDVSRTPSTAVSLNEGMPEFNFNAALEFDGSAGSMLSATTASGSPDDETFIAITRYIGNGSIEGVISYGSKGIYVGGSSSAHQYVIDGSGAGTSTSSNSANLNDTGASLISAFYRAETTTNSSLYTNGALSENYLGAGRIPTGTSTSLEIGGRTLGGLTERVFQGEIAEVIQISSDVSGLQQQSIVESYLASKYGISLDQTLPTDYVDSAGAVVWRASDNVGYSADIFALSRDDLYNLDQRVSKSVNAGSILTIALDADFTSPNQSAARTTAHANDKQYLYLSNNGESTNTITTEVPSNEPVLGNNRIEREWRVTKSANFGQATHLSFSGFDNAYYLVSDTDGDFSSGATVMGRLSAAGEYPGVQLSDGIYLTLVKGLDTDSDGVIDLMDSDDDNDGIPDSVEGDTDSDNDGIPNRLDTDSDGDGISDITEGAGDTDGDGTPNYLDEDSDGDGVPDQTEGPDTFIVVDSATVSGAEDTAIPLGINIDPAILTGGAQLDLLGTDVGFRDADDGTSPVTFTIPQQATYLRITGVGASDNASSNGTEEDMVFTSMLVDIRKATYSGHTALIHTQRFENVNYTFSDVQLGESTLSGTVVGHSETQSNELTVSLSGNTLSIMETQAVADQAFHVEYLTSSDSSSQYLGASAMVMATGITTDSITMPIDTDFATLSIMMAKTTSTDAYDEDKGVGYVSLDLETQTASGVIYVHSGAGDLNVSSYAFNDYDLTAGIPLLSSSAQVVGDTSANSDALSNLTLSLSGNVLTIARTSDMASNFNAMFSANSYKRLAIGSSARSLGSSAVTGTYNADTTITNEYDLSIPGYAETAVVSLAMYNRANLGTAVAQQTNENSGVASFSIDLENETTSGAIMIMRSSTPDLVSWKNLPFGTRLMDHADTVSNHAAVTNLSDQFAGVLTFNRVSLPDGSDALRMSANPETTGTSYHKYQVVFGAQWSGQLPVEFATSVANGSLSHGALDPDSGLWVVDPTDVNNLAFIPAEHFSGADTQFTINYNGENDTVEIDVTRLADAPAISTLDAQGTQRVVTDAADSYTAALVDVDGSESLFIELTVTVGHTISDGTSSFTATAGNSKVDVSSWNSSNLTYLADDVGVFPVGVRAVATDTDGFSPTEDTAETTSSFSVTLLLDTDADGDADIIDTDDDNDGISDVDEGTADSDGDGTPDSLDTDSDGDGVPDATEGGGDADGDGILDHIDNDTDGDGISDAAEGSIDSDGDSIPNYLDTDSDGDGLGDAAEGAIDSDSDGILDYLDLDSDGDGINDAVEGSIDTDSDGILDYLDQDSDGDGINDSVEGALDSDSDGAPDYVDLDADGDGISDSVEGVVDTDSDGQPDYLDTDSDGDGISDADEGTVDSDGDGIPDAQDTDANNDGIPDADLGTGDQDGDGVPDYLDDDIDGDGIANISEGAPNPTDDSDGDGIPNYADTDSDNDGIDDAAEGNGDLDGDGIPDYLDGDSDGDGIADINEGSVDSDNDGIPDYADTDSDGDGVPDSAEGSADTDLDGIPDYLDLDVDGDGIPDAVEGFVDSDGDGTADYKDLDSDDDGLGDGAEGTVDSDGDGIADYLDPDSDNDGLLDSEEAAGDTDGDGIADYLDDDSDNDGIPDDVEGNLDSDGDGAPDYLDDDSDGDGIPDILEGAGDADGDLIPDYLDSDSDNDGIPDSVEGSGDFDNDGIPDSIDTDANGDGIPDAALGSGDQDGDDIPDYLDGDIDGDGIANGTEGSVVPAEDSDGDGIPNYADTDSDNDGIADVLEGTGDADGDGIPDAHDTDSDNDGLADSAEGILDSDQDGVLDYLDTDSDGDGINDSIETSADTDGDGIPNYLDTDSDNDGIGDALEDSGDTDGDGAPDFLDNDSDGDGITDGAEGSDDTDGDGIPDYLDSDSDGDGIPDVIEGSTDSDGDGIPDAQDTDANGDGIPDANLSDGDIDNDGIPDYLDGDIDGDGIPNGSEGALNPAADSDGDGIPNYADSDSDNDGVLDSEEGTGDADGDGLLDAYDPDADNDGIPDGLEGTNDTDGDGVADYLDSDSDNDGIPDSIEGSVDTDGDGIPDSQDSDGNNDGIPDSLLGSGDLDGDGIPDYLDSDIDGDGVSNTEEAQPDATTDTDGDGLPDFIDSDSDNDGVPDSEESRGDTDGDGIPDFADTDADGDGVPDVAEGFGDTDGDGVADFIDLDADNDGIPDVTEGVDDTDRDGVLDTKDLDSDNDGLPDIVEAGGDDVDGNGRVDDYVDNNNDGYDDGMAAVPLPVDNSDSDDLPDYKDLDSDNDGIPDTRESTLAALDNNGDGRIDAGVDAQALQQSSDFPGGQLLNDIVDEDGDGWADNIPVNMIVDTDGDGTPNHQDRDSDGDGINDLIEAGGVDEDGDGEVDGWNDIDADGIPDDIDADQLGTSDSDSDGDGIADFADADYLNEADADGDGIVDRFDIDPFDEGFARSSTGEPLLSSALPDTDGDGISDVQQPINEQGFIRTGLGGGGSLNPLSLLALWFFAAVVFRCRKATQINPGRWVWRKAMHGRGKRSLVAVAILFSVSGCSTLGFQIPSETLQHASAVPEQLKVGNHIYVAAGVGTSRLKPDTSEVTTFAVNDRNNGGQQLTLGVDVSRQLSLELHSADLGAAGLSPEGGINYNMHGASALIYAGKNRHNYKRAGFTGYGRVGYGVMENSAAGNIPYRQEESNHLLIGAGLEYMTPVGLGFRADVVSYEDDAQYAQLAIVYRMGSPKRQRGGVVVESGSDSPTNNTSEPLLQAAIAVSQELSACTMEASREG